MSKIILSCAECKKPFTTYTESYNQYCSVGCQLKKFEEHSPNCGWHRDWHNCNCGAFDLREKNDETETAGG